VSSKSDFLIYFFNQQSTKIHNKACRYAGAVQAHRCVYCVGLLLIWLLTCVSHPGPESSYLIIGSYIFIAGLSVFVRGWGRRAGVECPFSGWVTYHCTALNLLRETEEIMGGHEKQNNSMESLSMTPTGAEQKPCFGFWNSGTWLLLLSLQEFPSLT
jgi:hypothetical protein